MSGSSAWRLRYLLMMFVVLLAVSSQACRRIRSHLTAGFDFLPHSSPLAFLSSVFRCLWESVGARRRHKVYGMFPACANFGSSRISWENSISHGRCMASNLAMQNGAAGKLHAYSARFYRRLGHQRNGSWLKQFRVSLGELSEQNRICHRWPASVPSGTKLSNCAKQSGQRQPSR